MNKNVIAITVEGLSTSLAGPYGSNTAMTPALNELAARGIVLDQCFVDSQCTESMLTSLWTAEHALSDRRLDGPSLWRLLEAAGGYGVLITDCPRAAALAEKHGCGRIYFLDLPLATVPAQEISDCRIVTLMSQAADVLSQIIDHEPPEQVLCWIHSRGFRSPWDAPVNLRVRMADAEDPEPPDQVGPPGFEVTPLTDPDQVLGWGQVAAAQSVAIDQALDMLREAVLELPTSWAWCLIGLGGVPLGEHGQVGWGHSQLFSEELQAVVLVVPDPPLPIGSRRSELSQLPDVAATIAQLCCLRLPKSAWGLSQFVPSSDTIPGEWPSEHTLAGLAENGKQWLRAPAWSLTQLESETTQLFVKPDDRWDVNDVSSRCPDIVAELQKLGAQFVQAARSGRRRDLPRLAPTLCNLIR